MALLTLLAAAVYPSGTTGAAPAAKRSVVVLEYRQAVKAFPNLAKRLTQTLRAKTNLQVLGPTAARQRLGSAIDDAVAQCQGKPDCIARLGGRLAVKEVILIGMSSLGDVIIQLSRIDVGGERVLATAGHTAAESAKITAANLFAWSRRLLPRSDFIRYGAIRVNSNQHGATVYLDDAKKGITPLAGPLKVRAPAFYDVRVEKKGYVGFKARLKVPPQGRIQVNASLVPIAAPSKPWYKRWWVWTIVATGAAAIIGITTGVVVGVRRPDSVPAVIRF